MRYAVLAVLFAACGGGGDATNRDAGADPIDAATNGACVRASDCDADEVCAGGECLPATCEDLALTGIESDIDCGGDCMPCTEGQRCGNAFDCMSRYCDPSGVDAVCRDCTTQADCDLAGDSYCSQGACIERSENGASCESGDVCSSGNCVDGVCCATPCDGTCEQCGADGQCAPIPQGQDSQGDCTAASGCGQTGACDGQGGCQLANQGVACATESCSGGGQGTCDGNGVCMGGAGSCNPYTCNAGSSCFTSCPSAGNRTQCASGNYCNGSACVSKQANGASCTQDFQCSSEECVDGVCCNSACDTNCKSCLASLTGGQDGICGNTLSSAGAQSECPAQSAASCGRTGLCSGGACQLHSASTVCLGQTCTGNGTLTPERSCNGSGTCSTQSSSSCPGNYACQNGTSCRTSCTTGAHCQPGFLCSGGSCVATLPNGSTCSMDSQCTSGRCDSTCMAKLPNSHVGECNEASDCTTGRCYFSINGNEYNTCIQLSGAGCSFESEVHSDCDAASEPHGGWSGFCINFGECEAVCNNGSWVPLYDGCN